jgi:hypothetical protein
MSGWWSNMASKATGLMSKVAGGVKSAASGVMGKVKSVAGGIAHHGMDALKTAGHIAANYAPQIAGAALGAIGNHLVPGLGGIAGKQLGHSLGQSVKNWHDSKYGGKYTPETATGQMIKGGVKRVSTVARTIRKVSKAMGATAAGAVSSMGQAAVNAIKAPKKKVKIVERASVRPNAQ